jgi:hypothetical protein
MSCSICGAPSSGGQYCIGCGEPLGSPLTASRTAVGTRQRARPAPGAWLALQEIRLLACPKCGAPNSAARWRCARCGQTFDDRDRDDNTPLEATPEQAVAVQPESARWLVLITAAAGVAVVAVAVMMMSARGIGPFAASVDQTAVADAVPIVVDHVDASDEGAEGTSVTNLVDGDSATAWQLAGAGVGEWVELHFGQPVQVDYLLVSNGDQRSDGSFRAASRVAGMVIEFPDSDKVYEVKELPDRQQNVRVTLKRRPPVTDMIRIRITSVHDREIGVTALSEIEALAHRDPPAE